VICSTDQIAFGNNNQRQPSAATIELLLHEAVTDRDYKVLLSRLQEHEWNMHNKLRTAIIQFEHFDNDNLHSIRQKFVRLNRNV
jgi:hypothetical protein